MRNSTGFGLNKRLSLLPALILLLLFVSCSQKSEVKIPVESVPEKSVPYSPRPEAIEFTAPERSTKTGVFLNGEAVGDMKESDLRAKLAAMAAKIDIEAVDATMDSKTWQIKKGSVGRRVNTDKSIELLLSAAPGQKIGLVVEEVIPPVTSKKLSGNIAVIGNYTTKLINRSKNRVNNIDIAAEKINYYKLSPGQEFSFNKVLGRRTEAKGYEDAPIIIKTESGPKNSKAVGGGICQLSTTLYNALEECRIEILERHLHSKDVGYVPKGEDATVSYGSADFRFRNSRSHPIMIRTSLGKNYLNVKIIENRNL